MGTHPSERGIRRSPDGPENPAKRSHLRLAAKAIGLGGAISLGAAVGLGVVVFREDHEIRETVESVFPSVSREEGRVAERKIVTFRKSIEDDASKRIVLAIERQETSVVVPIPSSEQVRNAMKVSKRAMVFQEVYSKVDEQTGTSQKAVGGMALGFGGLLTLLAKLAIEGVS